MRRLLIVAFGLIIILACGAAGAKDGVIKSEITAYLVRMINSKESLVKIVDSVEPENIVEYRFTYTNQGKSDISGLTVVGLSLIHI